MTSTPMEEFALAFARIYETYGQSITKGVQLSENKRNGGFTEAERAKGGIGIRAYNAAVTRLCRLHREEFTEILNEERAQRGLGPKVNSLSIAEMRRLADLAIRAGLE